MFYRPVWVAAQGENDYTQRVPAKERGIAFIDGGLVNNYPFEAMLRGRSIEQLLGFRVDSGAEIQMRQQRDKRPFEANLQGCSITTYLARLLEAATAGQETRHNESKAVRQQTVYCDDCGISTLKFALTPLEKRALVASGQSAAAHFISRERLQLACGSAASLPLSESRSQQAAAASALLTEIAEQLSHVRLSFEERCQFQRQELSANVLFLESVLHEGTFSSGLASLVTVTENLMTRLREKEALRFDADTVSTFERVLAASRDRLAVLALDEQAKQDVALGSALPAETPSVGVPLHAASLLSQGLFQPVGERTGAATGQQPLGAQERSEKATGDAAQGSELKTVKAG